MCVDVAARESKKLTLIYLANDIIQNSKRKGHEYSSEFGIVMAKALENVYQLVIHVTRLHVALQTCTTSDRKTRRIILFIQSYVTVV